MPIHRLNHAVLRVPKYLGRSVAFYRDVLGFHELEGGIPGAAFMQAPGSTNDHDHGLFQIGENAGPSGAGGLGRRAVPPRLGGGHARRA